MGFIRNESYEELVGAWSEKEVGKLMKKVKVGLWVLFVLGGRGLPGKQKVMLRMSISFHFFLQFKALSSLCQ